MSQQYKREVLMLLQDNQKAFLEAMSYLGVHHGVERLRNILDGEEYEVLKVEPWGVTSIRKRSTGEVFTKGDMVWSLKYDTEIGPIEFDDYLSGTDFFGTYYKNWVRCPNGIYPLNLISKHKPAEKPEYQTIELDGKKYNLVPKED